MTRAIVWIPEEPEYQATFILNGIRLPAGYHPEMRSIVIDHQRFCTGIIVRGPDIPDTKQGVELPTLKTEIIGGIITVLAWTESHHHIHVSFKSLEEE